MDKMISAAVAKSGRFYDANTNTLYVSTTYNKKRLSYGSDEYKTVREFRSICADLTIEIVKRAPKKRPLSYDMMKKFISILPTAEEDMKEMECQQKLSVAYKSPYKYMELWFNEKYPFHKEMLSEKENGEVEWDVIALMRLADAQKKEKETQKAEVPAQTSEVETQNKIVELLTPEVVEVTPEVDESTPEDVAIPA